MSMFWHFSALEHMYPHFGGKIKIKEKKGSVPRLIFNSSTLKKNTGKFRFCLQLNEIYILCKFEIDLNSLIYYCPIRVKLYIK